MAEIYQAGQGGGEFLSDMGGFFGVLGQENKKRDREAKSQAFKMAEVDRQAKKDLIDDAIRREDLARQRKLDAQAEEDRAFSRREKGYEYLPPEDPNQMQMPPQPAPEQPGMLKKPGVLQDPGLLEVDEQPSQPMPVQRDPGNSRPSNGGWVLSKSAQEERDLERQAKRKNIENAGLEGEMKRFELDKKRKEAEMGAGKPLSASSAAKLGNFFGALDAAQKIEETGKKMPTGKIEAMKDFGRELFGTQGEDRARGSADIASQRNEVMNRLAGANVTATELPRVLEGIPTRTDAGDVFQGKAKSTTDLILNKAETEIEALEAAGYNVKGLRDSLEKRKMGLLQSRGLLPTQESAPPPSVVVDPTKMTREQKLQYIKENSR